MGIQKMSLTLNHFIIIKFHIVETKTILIRKVSYFKHCLDIKISDIYKISTHISAYLNRAGIIKILNIYQKFSILKENGIIVYNTINNIIYNI